MGQNRLLEACEFIHTEQSADSCAVVLHHHSSDRQTRDLIPVRQKKLSAGIFRSSSQDRLLKTSCQQARGLELTLPKLQKREPSAYANAASSLIEETQ